MIFSVWDYDWLPACFVHTHINCRGHNYLPALGAASITHRICWFIIQIRGISSVWLPRKLFSTDFSKQFSFIGAGHIWLHHFCPFFGHHLLCWSRESTLVKAPHPPTPTCSKYFYSLPCILPFWESWAMIIHKGSANTVQNPSLALEKIPLLASRSKPQSTPILSPS